MKDRKRTISLQMILFEFRKTIGNPYVHIFGVGMPVLMMIVITRVVGMEVPEGEMRSQMVTAVFLGIGALIPLATVLMGYAVSHAQELEKGIPQRMELFGIRPLVSLCSRAVSEVLVMLAAFCVYFTVGFAVVGVNAPAVSGAVLYLVCILALSVILFGLAHGVASLLRKFSLTYCVTMLLYFALMMLGGMMGISYDNLSAPLQAVARLLPVTYFSRDFYIVWSGDSYNFAPMLQAYLFLGAAAGILLFFAARGGRRKLH